MGCRPGSPPLNYRHAFHAGNFADVFKHAVWLHALAQATGSPGPLEVLDTHAGAGGYDLSDLPARRAGEAEAGIGRLMADPEAPEALRSLIEAVRRLNGGADGPLYPGSPWLTLQALRPGDRLVACELRADDHAALATRLREAAPAGVQAQARLADGYDAAQAARPGGRRLVLIDPPFERGDEVSRLSVALRAVLRRGETAIVWAPLKDLDGFDRLLDTVEALDPPPSAAVELRLRPLDDPLRLNGCVLLLMNAPDLAPVAHAIAAHVAGLSGGEGAGGRTTHFGA